MNIPAIVRSLTARGGAHRSARPAGPRRVLMLMALAILVAAAAPSGAQAADTPEWMLSALPGPTIIAPGSEGDVYTVTVANVGGASTDGTPVFVSFVLPPELTATAVAATDTAGPIEPGLGNATREPLPCEIAVGSVRCVDLGIVVPGDVIQLSVTVNAQTPLPPSLEGEVEVSGGGTPALSAPAQARTGSTQAPFGFAAEGLHTALSSAQAGAHPNFTAAFAFDQSSPEVSAANPRRLGFDLPPGLVGDPGATPRCTMGQVVAETCAADTIVGIATVIVERAVFSSPIYNLRPAAGEPAAFAFTAVGYPVRLDTSLVHTSAGYRVHVEIEDVNETVKVFFSSTTFWGVPAQFNGPGPAQAAEAAGVLSYGGPGSGEQLPLLRNPTGCEDPLTTDFSAASWQDPGLGVFASQTLGARGGCDLLRFAPTIAVAPETTTAGSPSGYEVDIHVPQNEEPGALATADLRDSAVTMPAGTVVSPSAADGLQACTDTQLDLESESPATCPPASQVGTVKIRTPLLEEALEGRVFVGAPECAPCSPADAAAGRLIRLFIEAEGSGIVVKIPGSVSVNPGSGQLTAHFTENPQLPFEDLRLRFEGGSRAPLANPNTCGPARTTTDLRPWSAPLTPDATPSSEFDVTGCAPSRFAPTFKAGTASSQAGAFSPFTATFSRTDADSDLAGIQLRMPPGLLGIIAGVPLCADAQAAAGTCADSSLIGHTTTGAGPGATPFYLGGKVFLTGPYKGAPYGLSIVVPAIAGPFDLGTVVVRAQVNVDPETAALTVTTDPLPQSLDGIPLQLKTIRATIDRPNFTFNPTDCEPLSVGATIAAASGATSGVSTRFQATDCSALAFKPGLALKLSGGTTRHSFPALRATLTYPKATSANIAKAQVTLPHSEFLEQGHIGTVCTRVQFAAAKCPAASVYGHARAMTPILAAPLEGPVYLRSSSHKLPDLVAVLQAPGPSPVEIDLDGRIDTGKGGGIRTTFAQVPDAPVSKFTLSLFGGKKGLLVNSEDLCASGAEAKAIADFTAQSGKVLDAEPVVHSSCAAAHRPR
jgi:hypothetical protein